MNGVSSDVIEIDSPEGSPRRRQNGYENGSVKKRVFAEPLSVGSTAETGGCTPPQIGSDIQKVNY